MQTTAPARPTVRPLPAATHAIARGAWQEALNHAARLPMGPQRTRIELEAKAGIAKDAAAAREAARMVAFLRMAARTMQSEINERSDGSQYTITYFPENGKESRTVAEHLREQARALFPVPESENYGNTWWSITWAPHGYDAGSSHITLEETWDEHPIVEVCVKRI
jgi:hypothetical protein